MDPAIPDINISDVVVSKAGHDQDEWFYVIGEDQDFLLLANGKDRPLDKPKRKKCKHVERSFALRPESPKSFGMATKCSTANYEEIWRSSPERMQANNLGG